MQSKLERFERCLQGGIFQIKTQSFRGRFRGRWCHSSLTWKHLISFASETGLSQITAAGAAPAQKKWGGKEIALMARRYI